MPLHVLHIYVTLKQGKRSMSGKKRPEGVVAIAKQPQRVVAGFKQPQLVVACEEMP
jgi:hypothetical protein